MQRQLALRERATRATRPDATEDPMTPTTALLTPTSLQPSDVALLMEVVPSPPVVLSLPNPSPLETPLWPGNVSTTRSSHDGRISQTFVVSTEPPHLRPPLPLIEPATIEISLRPVSALTTRSSGEGMSLHSSVFSKRTAVTTRPSNDSVGSAYPRTINSPDLETETGFCSVASATASNDRHVASMPILTLATSESGDMATKSSQLTNAASAQINGGVPATPTCNGSPVHEGLSPIVEVQTPLRPCTKRLPGRYNSISKEARTDAHLVPEEVQLPDIGIWLDAVRQSEDKEAAVEIQGLYSPLFDDLRPTLHRRRWSTKVKTLVKNRIQAASGATKRNIHRAIQSTKKLGKTVRYFAPEAFGGRDIYESVASV